MDRFMLHEDRHSFSTVRGVLVDGGVTLALRLVFYARVRWLLANPLLKPSGLDGSRMKKYSPSSAGSAH